MSTGGPLTVGPAASLCSPEEKASQLIAFNVFCMFRFKLACLAALL